MSKFGKFALSDLDDLQDLLTELNLTLPAKPDVSPLLGTLELHGKKLSNRIVAHPMEGCDGETDGAPGELTLRRYRRFAEGGAGLIWFEACAVVPEGRANPRQLWLHQSNAGKFEQMLKQTLSAAEEVHGAGNRRFSVLQLTHSGRYSRPGAEAQPIIAARNPFLDPKLTVAPHVISDAELAGLEEDYVAAARLAHAAGFDAVDVKACHRYLINELLAAHTRKGEYGGTFENRARFLCNVVAKIKAACPELAVTLRLNVYDGLSYPYGWGVNQEDPSRPDLGEPLRLLGVLRDQGVSLVNLTMGNPYYAPHINRPYDQGPYRPPEHPLVGVHRMLALARTVQRAIPDLLVVGTGLSWLRQLGPQVAAACLQEGWFALAGFGRQMFAYPDLVRDLIAQGALNPKKCCLACGKCSEIMRYGGSAGCVIRDARMYAPVYKAVSAGKPSLVSDNPAEHV